MKYTVSLFFLLIFSISQSQSYDKLWRKVEAYELKGEIKNAKKIVNKIYKTANKKNEPEQLIKSFIFLSKFDQVLEEESDILFTNRIEKEIETQDFPVNAILSNIYSKFLRDTYGKYRYEINKRPQNKTTASIDYWTSEEFNVAIKKYYEASIRDKEKLQNTELNKYLNLLEGNKNTLKYRNSLYEFLVYDVISYYNKDYATRKDLNTNYTYKQLYSKPSEFIKLKHTSNKNKKQIKVIELLQDLERFHIKNNNYNQLMDAVITRFKLLKGNNNFENITAKITYLKQIIDAYKGKEASSILRFYLASYYYENSRYIENNKKEKNFRREALKICNTIIKNYPESEAALSAQLLIKSITSKLLKLKIETTESQNKPTLARIDYTNIDSIYVSFYKIPFNTFNAADYKSKRDSMIEQILLKSPLKQKFYKLPYSNKYYSESAEILLPKLDLGYYFVVASNKKQFTINDVIAYQTTTRSDLFVSEYDEKDFNVFEVSHRDNGKSVNNASIQLKENRYGYKIDTKTNSLGLSKVAKIDRRMRDLKGFAIKNNDSLRLQRVLISNYNDDNEWIAYNKLLMDRNIYRPGQTINFKGYLYQEKNGKRSVVPNNYCSVIIYDADDNEIKEFRLKTNEFGTFSDTYTLPKDIKTGEFIIEVDEDYDYEGDIHPFWDEVDDYESIEKTFYVEEYKRPRFEINFEPITENYILGDSIHITGKASSFYGNKVANSKITYTVEKGYKNNVFSGKTTTDNKGNFKLSFLSKTENSTQKKSYNFTINVAITDINGETQTNKKRFVIGKHNLKLRASFSSKITDTNTKFTITSANLNDGYINSKTTLEIYKVKRNNSVLNRDWNIPEHQTIDKNTFDKNFSHFPYSKENANATKKDLVYKIDLEIEDKLDFDLKNILKENGNYNIKIKGYAKLNDTSYIDRVITYASKKHKRNKPNVLVDYEIIDADVTKNKAIKLRLIPAYKDTPVKVNIVDRKKNTYSYAITVKKDTIVSLPVPKGLTGALNVSLHTNRFNRFQSRDFYVEITPENQDLIIESLRFNNTLEPNQKETWTFKIKDLEVNSEVLVSMYDESLDDFFKNKNFYGDEGLDWKPLKFQGYNNNDFSISSLKDRFAEVSKNRTNPFYYKTINRNYLKLNYFGLSFTNNKYVSKRYLEKLRQHKTKKIKKLGNISGIIVDKSGLTLPGVSVLVKGTTRGTQTDFDGFYSINAKKGEELVFSFVGMLTDRSIIKDSNSINILMQDDVAALDEVVITGYSTTTKASSSVSSITVQNRPNANFVQTLSGQLPGLNITTSSGQPGANSLVQLRGVSSINGNKEPLFIVDGVPMDESSFRILNTTDIATLNVLKDAGATAIYGSRGANGVIVVTTKYGSTITDTKEGKVVKILSENDIAKVETRKHLKETAFFFPHLVTKNDSVSFTFDVPQTLTRWKVQLLAHNKNTENGYAKLNTVTKKDLVVSPNLPRFLRETDSITITTKISNLSKKELKGNAYLQLINEANGDIYKTFKAEPFVLKNNAVKNVWWNVYVPENIDKLRYKIIAKTDKFSDGEEGVLDVLKKRILVNESLSLMLNANDKKVFEFKKLSENSSKTLQHKSLKIEFTSNPVLLSLNSMPYLKDFEFDCTEQTFSKYYANILGNHLINSNPKIKTYIVKQSDSLKNLKYLLDTNKLKEQEQDLILKLDNLQLSSGAFSWFSAEGKANNFVTRHILATNGHLKKLGIAPSENYQFEQIIKKAIKYLDIQFEKRLIKKDLNIKTADYHYLYARSFYLKSHPLSDKTNTKKEELIKNSKSDWITKPLYDKALIALTLNRFGEKTEAKQILKALKQSSITNDEKGRFWKENTNSIYWQQSPIETQALIIEAFTEIDKSETKTTDQLKKWLLRQKQSVSWKTTKATTEAIYALLLNGSDWVETKQNSIISIGDFNLNNKSQNLTGNIKKSFTTSEINNTLGKIEINNKTKSPGYGGVYWQYFEVLDKITTAETPLKLEKKLFLKSNTDTGEEISEITANTNLNVGDLVKVRIELRSDRDMEFLHLKDMRAAGFEPTNVISRYKWQDGFGYYESTKDAATNFFIDYLPKGVYVFEYDLRVNNAGDMSNGITTIQSMYAPEFSSHSEGIRIKVN